jgi:hypothetical protein
MLGVDMPKADPDLRLGSTLLKITCRQSNRILVIKVQLSADN